MSSTEVALPPNVYSLLEERNQILADMTSMAEDMRQPNNSFLFGIFSDAVGAKVSRCTVSADTMFDVESATKHLDARMWRKALKITSALEFMPLSERREFQYQIIECKCPEFTEENVIPTLKMYLSNRHEMLANTVDGIFSGLSEVHITNAPEGFGRRMIMKYIRDHSLEGDAGHIHDLRRVIAMIMNFPIPSENSSYNIIHRIPRDGKWYEIDGRALKIRRYLKGTAHLQVHPDMAWQLNKILASKHPNAIPAKFRTKAKRKASDASRKKPQLINRPIPYEVIQILSNASAVRHTPYQSSRFSNEWVKPRTTNPNNICLSSSDTYGSQKTNNAFLLNEACNILRHIGGTPSSGGEYLFEFNYDPKPVVNEIILSGIIPDEHSHQYCPTGSEISEMAADLLEVEEGMSVLEPSAGTGDLIDALKAHLNDMSEVRCVEVSSIHSAVLKSKGYSVETADFISWSDRAFRAQTKFDRIIMNPPYCGRQWRDHLVEAMALLAPAGRLVAVLPSSSENAFERIEEAKGWHVEFHRQKPADFGFANNISTTIVVMTPPMDVADCPKMAA